MSYEPRIESLSTHNINVDLDYLANSSLKILKGSSEEILDTLLSISGSSAGARPKAMIQINSDDEIIHGSQKLENGFEHYLIKFPSLTDIKEIGKLEYIYSLMAKDAKINIPNIKLLDRKENSYFTIKRFDRIGDSRVHIHSVAGMVHSDFRLPSLDYDDLLSLSLHVTKNKEEQIKMFRLAVFNLFVHNRDDHAKNFSFLLDENSDWKLSPAYDLTFSFDPGGEHSTTYLGEGKDPTIEHLKKLAIKHSIKDFQYIINEIKEVVANFKQYAKKLNLSQNTTNDIYQYLLKSIK